MSVHRKYISKVQPTRCNVSSIDLVLQIALHVSGGFSAHHQEHKTIHTASGIVKPILLLSWMRWNYSSMSSRIGAGSSIGLTIPDAICTILCSWWWAEEPPETCREIYRNKYIEETLYHVGCTLEIHWPCYVFCSACSEKVILHKLCHICYCYSQDLMIFCNEKHLICLLNLKVTFLGSCFVHL